MMSKGFYQQVVDRQFIKKYLRFRYYALRKDFYLVEYKNLTSEYVQ